MTDDRLVERDHQCAICEEERPTEPIRVTIGGVSVGPPMHVCPDCREEVGQ